MARSMLDFINAKIEREQRRGSDISLKEWTEIRRTNDPEAIAEAWERVVEAGGYNNLD